MIFSKKIKVFVATLLICILPYGIQAQDRAKIWKIINFDFLKCNKEKKENTHKHQYSVGTNLLSWVYFGTANLEFNASLNNHFSVFAGGKYNPFKITTKGEKDIFHTQKTGYLGAKWWPWFVNTGWWIGMKGQYSRHHVVLHPGRGCCWRWNFRRVHLHAWTSFQLGSWIGTLGRHISRIC